MFREVRIFSAATLPSTKPAGMALGAKMEYLFVNEASKNVSKYYQINNTPLFEFRVDHSVGESFTTNPDSFKHTVTLQLV